MRSSAGLYSRSDVIGSWFEVERHIVVDVREPFFLVPCLSFELG